MPRWIKKTPLRPQQEVPLRVVGDGPALMHQCVPPGSVSVGPRSIWECDCGQRWRIAVPYWRRVDGGEPSAVEMPAWVRSITDQLNDPA